MTSVFVFTSGGPAAPSLTADLEASGLEVTEVLSLRSMVQDVIRGAPDAVVCYESHPDDALFAVTAALQETAARPVVLFTADPDVDKIERAAAAGIHAYVIGGYGAHRLRSVIHVAQARFRREQALREELSDVRSRFSERKLVDRAKGIIMRVRDLPEEAAFKVLRSAAMQSKQRIGQVAQQVIDATRYADAVNRAGRLRMLSQRIVKLSALQCAGVTPAETSALCRASMAEADAILAHLDRSLSKATFGDLLAGVLSPWSALKAAVKPALAPRQLAEIDRSAEKLLQQAEILTRTLEMAGFTAALRIINVSGRQRMLSQRVAKLSLMATLGVGSADTTAELDKAVKAFEEGLVFLGAVPLSSGEIQDVLAFATQAWSVFRQVIARAETSRHEIADLSEVLLARFEELTDLYEQGMELLLA